MSDWVITIPKHISWETYWEECKAAAAGALLNYRLPRAINVKPGERVFVVWNGKVRGWMVAVGVFDRQRGFQCLTTGICWPPGVYLQRTGTFHLVDGPDMRGFQGIRRYRPGEGLT